MALTTGFDVPETDCVMICRPSQSRILYEQIIGRGLRLAEGKSDCLIVDIQDIVKRHNLMDVSTIFDTKIKHGETLRKARKRIEEEKEAEKKRQEEFERKRIEAEQQRQREMEIVAQRIKLFNRDLKLGFENRKLDWFRVDATTFALGYGLNQYYAIESDFDLITNKDRFNVFEVCTGKENKTVSYIIDKENVIEAIEYIEKLVKKNTYSDPNAQWKNDPPTENQLKFCGWAKTKWQVSKYFASSSISSIIKKSKAFN
jgi:hypothetical protein